MLAVHSMGHDTGACLYEGARLVAAVETERLTRRKHEGKARAAVDYVMAAAGIRSDDLDLLVFSTNVSPLLSSIDGLDAISLRIGRGTLHAEGRSRMFGRP